MSRWQVCSAQASLISALFFSRRCRFNSDMACRTTPEISANRLDACHSLDLWYLTKELGPNFLDEQQSHQQSSRKDLRTISVGG